MWTKEQRLAAFQNPQLVRDGDKIYLAITADFGRHGAVMMDTLYQRIGQEGDTPKKTWHGTKIAADNRFEEQQRRLAEHRQWRMDHPPPCK